MFWKGSPNYLFFKNKYLHKNCSRQHYKMIISSHDSNFYACLYSQPFVVYLLCVCGPACLTLTTDIFPISFGSMFAQGRATKGIWDAWWHLPGLPLPVQKGTSLPQGLSPQPPFCGRPRHPCASPMASNTSVLPTKLSLWCNTFPKTLALMNVNKEWM